MPVEFPTPLARVSFKPGHQVAVNSVRSGAATAIELGPALWFGEYETIELTPREIVTTLGFINNLRGGILTTLLYDPRRRRPFNSGTSGTPWGAGAVVTTVSAANRTVTLGTVTNGFTFAVGDYLSYQTLAGGWYLGQVTADTVTAAGAVVLPVFPTPRVEAVTENLRIANPQGEFIIVPNTEKEDTSVERGTVSFSALYWDRG